VSWILTGDDYAKGRAAFAEGELIEPLYSFIGRLVSGNVRSGVVSPTLAEDGVWNVDSISEATHAWLEERLLRGGLQRAFDVTSRPQTFARYLEQSFRNWLRDRSRSRGWPRLLLRARELLDGSPERFTVADDSGTWLDRRYALTEQEDVPAASDDEVVRAIYVLPQLELLRHNAQSDRAAPVLSTPDLEALVEATLCRLGKSISLRQLDRAFRHRFAWAYEAAPVELDDTASKQVGFEQIGGELIAEEQARTILAGLSERQLLILRDRAGGATFDQLARQHDCSRGTVENELKRAASVIREALVDDENYERALEFLLALAFSERG
jgi:hypothetical protein